MKFWDQKSRAYIDADPTIMETFGDLPPVEHRQTFEVPAGYHAEIGVDGRATGYVINNTNGVRYNAVAVKVAPVSPASVPANDNGARKGDWMQTFSGRQFWPIDPRADEIFIEDIAHSLAMQCRFGGHCIQFYSVAEHSVHIANWLLPRFGAAIALWGLLHDASEAYLVDVPRPVKPFLEGYRAMEAKVMAEVCIRFGLPSNMPGVVHEADSRIIANERRNMAPSAAAWFGYDAPQTYRRLPGVRLHHWFPDVAEIYFLDTFKKLADARAAENMGVAA